MEQKSNNTDRRQVEFNKIKHPESSLISEFIYFFFCVLKHLKISAMTNIKLDDIDHQILDILIDNTVFRLLTYLNVY